jgi:hypothetical protein
VAGSCDHGGVHWVFLGQLSDCHLVKEDSGCAMRQAISRRPVIAVARFRPKANPCGIYGGKSDTEQICECKLRNVEVYDYYLPRQFRCPY